MKLVTRAEWGARPPTRRARGTLSGASTCHWEGPTMKVGGSLTWDHSKCASLIRGIQNFHMNTRGWSDIAYNFLVCPHGYTFEGRGLNVINAANGTTVGNRTSHTICCLAGTGNPFTFDEKLGLRETVLYIALNGSAQKRCIGHRDWHSTDCPGDDRYEWVHGGMKLPQDPTPQPEPEPPTVEDDEMVIRYRVAGGAQQYMLTVCGVVALSYADAVLLDSAGQTHVFDWSQKKHEAIVAKHGLATD